MSDYKEKVQTIACDLSLAMREMDTGNFDDWENACCRISDLMYELHEVYEAMCKVKF